MEGEAEGTPDLSAYQSRLNALEETISKLEMQQDRFRPLLKLTSGSVSFLKINQSIRGITKKCEEIDMVQQSNESRIEESKSLMASLNTRFQEAINQEKAQRAQEAARLNSKLAGLARLHDDAQNESSSMVKMVERTLKEEVSGLVQRLEDQLHSQKYEHQTALDEAQSALQSEAGKAKEDEGMLEIQVQRFEQGHQELIASAPQGKKLHLKSFLEKEVKARINAAIEETHHYMSYLLKTLKGKFTQEVLTMRTQAEQVRDVLVEQGAEYREKSQEIPAEKRLALHVQDANKGVSHLSNFSLKVLENIQEVISTAKATLADAIAMSEKIPKGSVLPEDVQAMMEEQIANIQDQTEQSHHELVVNGDRNRRDFEKIEAAIAQAEALAKELANPNDDTEALGKAIAKYTQLKRGIPGKQNQLLSEARDVAKHLLSISGKIEKASGLKFPIRNSFKVVIEESKEQ